ncbi:MULTISPECIES: hypothetical protein [unclassified Streptomyces]|uniref:hypothetical protein n=1 Tax=unclassified Streptomyces TaxID=2593676 RepID=UPI00136E5D5A|nr:hypothetical protein [Streptomyces sp. SID6139]MYR24000.1 hypothetical protein [Streptomyces sp. SID6137]
MPSAVRALGPPLLLMLTLLGTASPAAARPAGWSLAPAGGPRPSFYAEGAPGTALQDTVAVTNPGRTPVTVRLRGTGLPVVLARATLTVPARTRAEVPFTVTPPSGSAPGDRSGAIEARDGRGRTASVPVRLRIAGPRLAALTVEHLAVHPDGITYQLVNRGTTVLVPTLAVRADGTFGRVLDRAPRPLPVRLAPGTRRTLSEPWHGRPFLDRVDVRLTVTADGTRATATTAATFVPWGTLGALAGLAATATAAFLVRWRARRTRESETPSREAELTGAVV